MIDLHFWPTPNGWKITIFLEEVGLLYRVLPVNIGTGEQFRPEFLALSPNNRMPAIVDHAPADGGPPLSVFESGAILEYLGDKTGRFYPAAPRPRANVGQWLHWQIGGLGPMLGQYFHFVHYAADKLPYAMQRYTDEADRLMGVLDRAVADRDYLADDYSIADMAAFPWVNGFAKRGGDLEAHGNVRRWLARLNARPAVARGLAVGRELHRDLTDDAKRVLFGQTAERVATAAQRTP